MKNNVVFCNSQVLNLIIQFVVVAIHKTNYHLMIVLYVLNYHHNCVGRLQTVMKIIDQ